MEDEDSPLLPSPLCVHVPPPHLITVQLINRFGLSNTKCLCYYDYVKLLLLSLEKCYDHIFFDILVFHEVSDCLEFYLFSFLHAYHGFTLQHSG